MVEMAWEWGKRAGCRGRTAASGQVDEGGWRVTGVPRSWAHTRSHHLPWVLGAIVSLARVLSPTLTFNCDSDRRWWCRELSAVYMYTRLLLLLFVDLDRERWLGSRMEEDEWSGRQRRWHDVRDDEVGCGKGSAVGGACSGRLL